MERKAAVNVGVLVAAGHDPEDFLEWSDTKRALAAGAALRFEQWKLEQLGL